MRKVINFIDCSKELPSENGKGHLITALVLCENQEIHESIYIVSGKWITINGFEFGDTAQTGEGSKVTHWAYIKQSK